MDVLYDIERVVPHRGTMRLVDRLVAWDEDTVTVELRVPEEGPFSHDDGVPAWVGVEYMAQAIAAWAGCHARRTGREPLEAVLNPNQISERVPARKDHDLPS